MASSKDARAQRVKELGQYINNLHMVLDNVVQRVRKLESYTGMDEEGIQQTLEWREKIEASLIKEMRDHNWNWQSSDNPKEVYLGNVVYERILNLCEMLPADVQMKCWNQVDTPKKLPLVWSEASTIHTSKQVPEHVSEQTDKVLVKKLKDALKLL